MSARVFELEGSLSFDSSGFYKAVKEAVEAGEKLKQELERNDKAMESMEKAVADTDKALQKVEDSTSDFTKETKESTSATADLDKKMDSLNETYSDSEKQVEELKKELEKVIEQVYNDLNGKTFEHTDTFFYPEGVTTKTKFIQELELHAESGGGDGRDCEAHPVR